MRRRCDERAAGRFPSPTAFRFWLKLGFISFGGPAGQIAVMHQELVERRRWISERRFLHALNYCMLLPGPEAQQLATYIGWLMHRTWGGIVAGALFVLPSLFILIALSWIYVAFGYVPAVAGVLYGIKPAVTAIVVFAAWRIGSRALRSAALWAIAAAAFVAIFALDVPFPAIVIGAGSDRLSSAAASRRTSSVPAAATARPAKGSGPAIIDDDTPTPEHARFTWGRLRAGARRRARAVGARDGARSSRAAAGKARSRRWAGSSPRPRCSPSAAPTRCCPTSTRARSSTTAGSPRRR